MLEHEISFPSIAAGAEVSKPAVDSLDPEAIRKGYPGSTAFVLVILYPSF
jgi:hypothetical protein